MKVLVTGGNGFIGRHVVRELASRKIEVISFDITPPQEEIKGVTSIVGTIIDEFLLGEYMKQCDAVLHLAAVLGVKRAEKHLLKCLTINIQGTIKILEACVMNNIPRVLTVSSSEVFGDLNKNKISETAPFNPKSGYAISKLAGEKYTEAFGKEYGLKYTVVRFFNIYGPGQVAEFVVPRFIKMVQHNIRPTIYGDGKQIRSFCHIGDAARALVDVFLHPSSANQTFNIGNDLEPVTMEDVAFRVIKEAGSSLKPVYLPFSESDREGSREIYYRVPDISKIRATIQYSPRITLDEGIKGLIKSGDIPDSWAEPVITRA
ncbi:MAG: NAD-dependent epimerase/dehydratase family protein [Candidatus Omnitrophica bacterium]|nr:NAD-dependent epimerase/dehydratase family protein [Candidatus Omnitrophota bacterium]